MSTKEIVSAFLTEAVEIINRNGATPDAPKRSHASFSRTEKSSYKREEEGANKVVDWHKIIFDTKDDLASLMRAVELKEKIERLGFKSFDGGLDFPSYLGALLYSLYKRHDDGMAADDSDVDTVSRELALALETKQCKFVMVGSIRGIADDSMDCGMKFDDGRIVNIRRWTDCEIIQMMNASKESMIFHHGRRFDTIMLHGGWAVEVEIMADVNNPAPAQKKIEETIDVIISALEIDDDCAISVEECESGFGVLAPSFYCGSRNFMPSLRRAVNSAKRYSINGGDAERLKNIVNVLEDLKAKNDDNFKSIKAALRRFRQSAEAKFRDDQLMEMVIALETALVSDNRELSYRLSLNTSYLIADEDAERKDVFGCVRETYKARSKTAHEGGQEVNEELVGRLRDITAKALWVCIRLGDSRETIVKSVESAILAGHKMDNVAYINELKRTGGGSAAR
jgi:hypothetical protein